MFVCLLFCCFLSIDYYSLFLCDFNDDWYFVLIEKWVRWLGEYMGKLFGEWRME